MATPETRNNDSLPTERPDPANEEDLAVFVEGLLGQMQSSFQQMSEAIITRIDDMGNRIDGLEKSIADLMNQAGVEEENQNPENPVESKQ